MKIANVTNYLKMAATAVCFVVIFGTEVAFAAQDNINTDCENNVINSDAQASLKPVEEKALPAPSVNVSVNNGSNTNTPNPAQSAASPPVISQKNELSAVKIWRFFKEKGLNDYAVAGIMGNLFAESGLISDKLQNSFEKRLGNDERYTSSVDDGSYGFERFIYDSAGYGLAQWTYYTRKAALYERAKRMGKSISDLEMQLGFLWVELRNDERLMNNLRVATTVRKASDAFLLDFERPADQGEKQRAKRAGYAQEIYEDFVNKNIGGVTTITEENAQFH